MGSSYSFRQQAVCLPTSLFLSLFSLLPQSRVLPPSICQSNRTSLQLRCHRNTSFINSGKKATLMLVEMRSIRIEPLQGNSSPLTSTLITVLPFPLPLYSQASWESYSHPLSSLPHLLSTLPAGYCPHQSKETVLTHVTHALLE